MSKNGKTAASYTNPYALDRYETMISYYSCGCYAVGDIPTISRCAEHNGWIVVQHNQNLREDKFKNGPVTVWLGALLQQLKKLPDEKFSYVYAYPPHTALTPFNWMTPLGWRNARMDLMYHLARILKPGGYISMVFEPSLINSIAYHAAQHGLKIDVRDFTFELFDKEPFSTESYAFADAKAHFILYKGYRERVPKSGAHLLDITGIKPQHALKRLKKNRLLVLTQHQYQFQKIRTLIGE